MKELHENFNERRIELLQKRVENKRELMQEFPKFLEETKHIREADWTIAKSAKRLRGSPCRDYWTGR